MRLQRMGADHVRNGVEQPAQMASQVGIPGVGMDQVEVVGQRTDHRQVGAEHAQRRVGALGKVLGVGGGTFTRLAHALHIDVDEVAQLGDELGHVDAGAAINAGWVLPGENRDLHGLIVPHGCLLWRVGHQMAAVVGAGAGTRTKFSPQEVGRLTHRLRPQVRPPTEAGGGPKCFPHFTGNGTDPHLTRGDGRVRVGGLAGGESRASSGGGGQPRVPVTSLGASGRVPVAITFRTLSSMACTFLVAGSVT